MGYDSREELAYDVARYSILSRTNTETKIKPLELGKGRLQKILTRSIEKKLNDNNVEQLWCPISGAPMTTEFAISRFAIPFLQNSGIALFIDCDMVCLDDITNLFNLMDKKYAVMVVKHNYQPTEKYHDAGLLQTFYQRKNWSSVVLWNLDHPSNKNLTLEALNNWPGRDLHAFKWLKDDEIGELPQEWNYLVGVNDPLNLRQQKMLHYTDGQPGWEGWIPKDTDYVFNEEAEALKKEKYDFYGNYLKRVKKVNLVK